MALNSSKELVEKINEILKDRKDAEINIINDKLTIAVFMALEENLKNVRKVNFIIRDTRFIPESNEISQEFEMVNPNDILYSPYDIIEKNKLKYFAKARMCLHNYLQNVKTMV